MDRYDQLTRNTQIGMTGLKDKYMTKESMVAKMNELLGCKLSVDDIAWVQKLRVSDQDKN